MSMRPPEILIIGTMKGGTTIVWTALRNHPMVSAGTTKEIHYFTLHAEKSLDWYVNQFPDRKSDVFAVDASPTYFDTANTPRIPQHIRNTIPGCRLILCVRDPVERAISHYHQLKRSDIVGPVFRDIGVNEFFARALVGDIRPQNEHHNHIKYAIDFSVYDKKYEHYLSVFCKSDVLVLENNEIVHDMNSVMDRVFRHCRLQPASVNYNASTYLLDRRENELDPHIRRELSERLYPAYHRFRELAGLPLISKA
jgi:hypothetical protein